MRPEEQIRRTAKACVEKCDEDLDETHIAIAAALMWVLEVRSADEL